MRKELDEGNNDKKWKEKKEDRAGLRVILQREREKRAER